MSEEKTDALTDMAYYNGARMALAALEGGMDKKALRAEMEARVAPARRYLLSERFRVEEGK
jgi:pyruvate-formate lyase